MSTPYEHGKAEGIRQAEEQIKKGNVQEVQASLDSSNKVNLEELAALPELYRHYPDFTITHAAYLIGVMAGKRAVLTRFIEQVDQTRSRAQRNSTDIETIIDAIKREVQQTSACPPQVFGLAEHAQVRCFLTGSHAALIHAGELLRATLGSALAVFIAVKKIKALTMLVTTGTSVNLGESKDLLTFVVVDRRQQTEEVHAFEIGSGRRRGTLQAIIHPPTCGQIWDREFPALIERSLQGRDPFRS